MPYGDTPWIRKGQFITEEGERIVVGSQAWFAWLQTATSFCYQPDTSVDRLTARKEKRGHQFYWYGYARNASQLHNVYLGKSEQLTRVRLDQACAQLVQKAMRQSGC
jgi:hypothetical protein